MNMRYSKSISSTDSRNFAFALGAFTTLGWLVTALGVAFTPVSADNMWALAILGFVVSLIGVFVNKSSDLLTSIFGLSLTAVGSGVMLSPIVKTMPNLPIVPAFIITVGMTAVLWVAGTLIPALPDLTRYVIGTLCVLILGSLCFVFFPGFQTQLLSNIWNSIGILIFSGLIVYDVNQAMNSDDQTPVSACQFALGIYLDMLNIFIRLLQVMGGGSSSKS